MILTNSAEQGDTIGQGRADAGSMTDAHPGLVHTLNATLPGAPPGPPSGPEDAGGVQGVHPSLPSAASLGAMPVTLHVRVPLSSFRLETLAALAPGSIVTTIWPSSEDLPVSVGGVRIAWAEFAIADHRRSVRVTRIA